MNWFYEFRVPVLLLFIAALIYSLLRIWRFKMGIGRPETGFDFQPMIGFTHLDAWESLALLLRNKSDSKVWTEEIEIVLSNLVANQQASSASCRGIHKIQQTVLPHDMLPISLMGAIYKAAGEPQRKYSCILSSIVRYRVGDLVFEKPMYPYSLKMAGLKVISNRRERWAESEFKPRTAPGVSVRQTQGQNDLLGTKELENRTNDGSVNSMRK